MNQSNEIDSQDKTKKHEPIFNLPKVVVLLAVIMIVIHLLLRYVVSDKDAFGAQIFLSFNPGFIVDSVRFLETDGRAIFLFLTPVTHAFLHADWMHLLLNLGFMVAFGAPVAKRIGNIRFLILFVMCAVGGAMLFWALNQQKLVFLIGASGAVSGFMGAASRFAFQPNIDEFGHRKQGLNVFGPALTLIECAKDRKFLNFFVIWMVMNTLFGTVFSTVLGGSGNIAWEAHIGGFLAGIFAFSFLDSVKST